VRYVTVALVLYLALDFGNPLIQGAVSFDPDDSVGRRPGATGAAWLPKMTIPTPTASSSSSAR
jgi:hypothetical protein